MVFLSIFSYICKGGISRVKTRPHLIIYHQEKQRKMKTHEKMHYEAPQVEVIEVEVEKGFAVSTGDAPNYGSGGSLNG
jgi:hypothetical protein